MQIFIAAFVCHFAFLSTTSVCVAERHIEEEVEKTLQWMMDVNYVKVWENSVCKISIQMI